MKATFRIVETRYYNIPDVEVDPHDPTKPANHDDVIDEMGEPDDMDTYIERVFDEPADPLPPGVTEVVAGDLLGPPWIRPSRLTFSDDDEPETR
jgi:hypothetical protein